MSNNKPSRVNVRLTPEQMKALKQFAQHQSSSRSSIVRCLINQHLIVNNGK